MPPSFLACCRDTVMSTISPKMENDHPLGFLGYIIFFVMDHLLRKFKSKELHEYKQRIEQLVEERNNLVKFEEEKEKDTRRFVDLLKNDNATMRKQLAEKDNTIQRFEDYLSHILAYAIEIRQKTTLQQFATYKIDSNFFDVYQNVLGALSAIRYGINSGKTLKRRDSRKILTEKNNYKNMYYEEICSNERLNAQLVQTQAELATARKQMEHLKQDKIILQKRISQDKSLNDGRIYEQLHRSTEQTEQYKNLLASYTYLENQFITLKNDYDIIVPYKEALQVTLEAKNSYISNIQKVLTSVFSLKYLFHGTDSTYDHGKLVSHLAEREDPTTRNRYFQNFIDAIKKAVMQERDRKLHQLDQECVMLKLTALQNKCENLQCLREDADFKCSALKQELKTKELTEANNLDEYNKLCVMHTNVSAEVKQKTREVENVNKSLQEFKFQAQENEDDLRKGLDQIKQSYHVIHEENVIVKSEAEAAQIRLHDLLVEKDDLLDKYNCLEEELVYAQNQLNQYKNPELMPSYQEVLKLYTEVKKVVDEAEHREKECAERNEALTEQINKLTTENHQLENSRPVFEKISAVYEAVLHTQNQQLLQKSEHANVKRVTQFYQKEIYRLDMENVKLLTALKDEQNASKHRKFKNKFEKMKAEINMIANSFDTAKLDRIVLNFQENLNKIAAETFEIVRKMSPENTSSAQLAQKYDELIEALKLEHERLQGCLNKNNEAGEDRLVVTHGDQNEEEEDEILSDSPYVNSMLKEIGRIRQNIRQLEVRVDKFQGSSKDKEYLDLEHKLLGSIMAIDVIQVEGHEIIREKRRQMVIYANNCMQKLEENVVE